MLVNLLKGNCGGKSNWGEILLEKQSTWTWQYCGMQSPEGCGNVAFSNTAATGANCTLQQLVPALGRRWMLEEGPNCAKIMLDFVSRS